MYIIGLLLLITAVIIACGYVVKVNTQKPLYGAITGFSECFITTPSIPYYPEFYVLGIKIEPNSYKERMVMDCVWREESTRGLEMFGDYRNGVPMAYGHFQIWLSRHPISYDCAMDYECSSSYFLKMVREDKGYLWTTYEDCVEEVEIKLAKY